MVLSNHLKDADLDWDGALNGAIALQKLMQNNGQYSLVFMDCEMPIMDGIECTRQIREKEKLGELKHVTVIGLSGHNTEKEKKKCLSVGMDDYLTKPILKPQLFEMLDKWGGN
jgi:CheY-like chemotaxis protein